MADFPRTALRKAERERRAPLKDVHHQLLPFGSAIIHVDAAKISVHHITRSKREMSWNADTF
jgi:hypothetical protein